MTNNYYQKHKEKFQKEACERYQYLSEKEKEKSVSIIPNEIIIFLGNKSKRKLSKIRNYYLTHKK